MTDLSPLSLSLSLSLQNKVLNIDGVRVKLQVSIMISNDLKMTVD